MEERVEFRVGDITLEGLLAMPAAPARCGVVVCHPHPMYGGDMHNNVVSALIDAFGAAGIATLRFNFRSVGNSGGAHDKGNAEVDDVKAAVGCLVGRQAFATVVVAGYSFGALVGLRAGAEDPRVHKLIGVALPIATRDASFLLGITKPKLLVCGDSDTYCPVPEMTRFVARLQAPKSLVVIDGADHFFGGSEERAAQAAVAFLTAGDA